MKLKKNKTKISFECNYIVKNGPGESSSNPC